MEPRRHQVAYTCKNFTGTAYAVSTDSDIYVDTADGSTVNINKPMTGGAATNPASPAVDMAEALLRPTPYGRRRHEDSLPLDGHARIRV